MHTTTTVSQLPHVSADDFEGPFDLLLELTKLHKIDISRVSLQRITDEFLTYIAEHTIPVEQQLDFLLVAATLLLIKVQRALPHVTAVEDEDEVSQLTDRLQRYAPYREKARWLRKNWHRRPLYSGAVRKIDIVYPDMTSTGEDLKKSLIKVSSRKMHHKLPTQHLRSSRGWSLQQCLHVIQSRLKDIDTTEFSTLVGHVDNTTKAVSFLAVLELARQGIVTIEQAAVFSPITVSRL